MVLRIDNLNFLRIKWLFTKRLSAKIWQRQLTLVRLAWVLRTIWCLYIYIWLITKYIAFYPRNGDFSHFREIFCHLLKKFTQPSNITFIRISNRLAMLGQWAQIAPPPAYAFHEFAYVKTETLLPRSSSWTSPWSFQLASNDVVASPTSCVFIVVYMLVRHATLMVTRNSYSTQLTRVVTHPSTNRAQHCLTTVI